MDSNSLLLIGTVAVIVNALILYIIISAATRAGKRAQYEWAQMELLAKIARAQGVSEEEIRAISGAIK
jgi:chromosome segregation and condensation protein ScpB